jgi:signal transduction histidine kinase
MPQEILLPEYGQVCKRNNKQSVYKRFINTRTILFLALIFCTIHSSAAGTKDTVRVQLRWTHQFQFAGFYAAIEQGYYADEGLEVKLIEGSGDYNFAELLLNGNSEFGVESTSLLISRNQNKPLIVLASVFQHSPETFITLAKYKINTIEDFSGKTALFSTLDLPATSGIIVKENIMDKVIPSISDNRIEGLIDGSHQIIDGYSIDMPYQIMKMGYHPVLISPINYGIDFYGDCIFTSEEYLHKHPKKTAAFLRATLKGWKYAMFNKKELIQLIIEKYNPNITEEELIFEARELEELIQPKFVEIGYMHKARWQHIGEVYVSLGMLHEDFSLDGFLYTDYVNNQVARQKYLLIIITIALIFLLASLFVVGFFNRKLKAEVVKQTKKITVSNQHLRNEIKERELIYADLIRTTKELKNNQHILSEKNLELKNAKNRAEESDKLKSAFLSNMSHEIRTPMNAIIGFSELLKDPDTTLEEKEMYTQIIEENSHQLLRIISDIIDISKIEVGELSVHKEPIHIKNLFDNILLYFSLKTKQLKNGKVDIKYEIKNDIPEIINTDPARLKQVLSNLIENAIKFTSEGSIVYTIEKDQSNYIFKVKDTGMGIAKEKLEKVFIRFFKESNQHFSDMGGTGLGLSIAKNMVELLGGKISLWSEQNVGTEFTFTHPID